MLLFSWFSEREREIEVLLTHLLYIYTILLFLNFLHWKESSLLQQNTKEY